MVIKMEKTIYQRVKEAEKMFGEYEITAKELARTRSLRERLEGQPYDCLGHRSVQAGQKHRDKQDTQRRSCLLVSCL